MHFELFQKRRQASLLLCLTPIQDRD